MRKKNNNQDKINIEENKAKLSRKMEAKCNVLGYLCSSDEMSRFTPNLYDDIFIFNSKNKSDAISERAKFKQPDFVEDNAPEIVEENVVEVITPVEEVVEEPVQEEITPDIIPEPVVEEEPVAEEPVVEAEKVYVYEPVELVALEPIEKELVCELEPIPVVVLEPVQIVTLEPVVAPIEEPEVYAIAEQIEKAEQAEEEPVVETIEEEPIIAEQIVEEEPIVEEEQVAPFMAIMIPSSTEEDAELLKERYKTVPLEKRFERAPEVVRNYYSELKNELLSYDNVKSRMSKKFDTFSIGRFTVAKLTVKNDVVKLYLALANDSIDTKYYTEDVSNSEIYDQTPTLHNVKSKRGLKYGIELIREIMESIGYQKNDDYIAVDFAQEFAPVPVREKKLFIADLMAPTISESACNVIANDLAYDMLNIVKSDEYTINKFYPVNKFRIYTDDLVHWFEDGETVTVATLQEKGALPKVENLFLEVHGRGVLDRRLFVEAHSYDMKAIKMILLTDGEVIQYK